MSSLQDLEKEFLETYLAAGGSINDLWSQFYVAGLASAGNYTSQTTWTPTFTFTTPGDVSVVYTTQKGEYVKVGNLVCCSVNLVGTITHTTAASSLRLAGLPFAASSTNSVNQNQAVFLYGHTITTSPVCRLGIVHAGTTATFAAHSSANSTVTALSVTQVPTGSVLSLYGQFFYFVA